MPLKDKVALRAYQRRWEAGHREQLRKAQRERYAANIERERDRSRNRSEEYRARKNARSKTRYRENRDAVLAYHRAYRLSHRSVVSAAKARWVSEHRGASRAIIARWVAARLRAFPSWADADAIKRIYDEAVSVTRETGIQHDVDHIVPLQGKDVCGLHVAWNLQVLPHVENVRKSNKWHAREAA